MALIEVKRDAGTPKGQEHEEIVMPLINPSEEDENSAIAETDKSGISQTLVYGIRCPIICIGGLVVNVEDIIDFELDGTGRMPSMTCHVYDNKNLIQQIVQPGDGNSTVVVQIIPPHDKYKKIDIQFIITDYSVGANNDLYIKGVYNIPEFTSKQFKSFGEMSIYALYDEISKETGLGFASNCENKDDKRFVFCRFTSFKDIIEQETNNSGEENIIYDWWIDPFHYLIFENLYERYSVPDGLEFDETKEHSYVWISNQVNDMSSSIEELPYQAPVKLANRFGMENSQLFIKDYRIINDISRDVYWGTGKVYSVYSTKKKEYKDLLFGDSDSEQAVKNFEYKGEVYGDYDYITNSLYHIPFIQKMQKEIVEIDLQSPIIGLTRGRQIIIEIYQNESDINDTQIKMEEEGILTPYTSIKPTGDPLDLIEGDEESKQSDMFKLDKTLSGQYLIVGNKYKYSNNEWTYTLSLARPADEKVRLMN